MHSVGVACSGGCCDISVMKSRVKFRVEVVRVRVEAQVVRVRVGVRVGVRVCDGWNRSCQVQCWDGRNNNVALWPQSMPSLHHCGHRGGIVCRYPFLMPVGENCAWNLVLYADMTV